MLKMEQPMISVIIPAYNVEKYLSKCIDSVINQTYKDFEILVVNDGSTDHTFDLIQYYERQHPNIVKGYTKPNKGLSDTRNYALDCAQGKYITFLDSDDYLDPDYLETLLNVAEKFNSDMVAGGQKKVDADGNILATLRYPLDKNPHTILRRLNISGKLYRRDYIEKHHMRFAEGKIYEDDPFNLVMLFLARNFQLVPYEGYNQLVRQGSITSHKIDASKMPYQALEDSIRYVVNHKDEVNDYDAFEYTVLSFFTYFIFQANKKHGYMKKNKNRTSDISTVIEFCDFTNRILNTYLPNYKKNPNVSLLKNSDLQITQRLGVWGYSHLNQWNMLNGFTKLYYKL